ncbi:MAG TPA: ABC transporter permease [Dehalococcoidia bacterium]|nr:ABC transporter permease [Dehalococcoidia bacterium]
MVSIIPNVKEKTRKQYTGVSRGTRIMKNLTLILPVMVLTLMVICAIFANLSWLGLPQYGLAPHDPNKTAPRDKFLPPAFIEGGKSDYLLGTDKLGRDILSRVIHGARVSLSVSLLAIFITAGVGTMLGIFSGYVGGRVDGFLMRIVDVALSFPGLLLAMLLAVAVGPGFWTVVFALSVLGWAFYARLVRGESLRIRQSDFVAQARVNGASPFRIMLRHIFPNVVNSLIVLMTLQVGMMILSEAALSYIGIGITAPQASWGSMVSDGRAELDRAWWISTFPGVAIGLVVMSGNFLGDWIRDKLDPRLRQV